MGCSNGKSANRRRRYRAGRLLAAAGVGLILGLVVLMGFLWTQLESRFIFFPTRELNSNPGKAGLSYEDVTFTTDKGRTLHGWFVPGTTGNNVITWLWLHGNGGNISHRVEELAMIRHRLGVNVFIFDYQGYGRSEGKPTEEGTYQDARAALEHLEKHTGVAPDKIVYFGRSLGSAVAVNLAVEHPPLGLVLVSPFSSVEDMARVSYPFLPLGWLTRGRYNSMARIGLVKRPVLIIHGELDNLVPVAQAKLLFDAANEPKGFQALPGAAHNDIPTNGGSEYWNALERFLAGLAGANDRVN